MFTGGDLLERCHALGLLKARGQQQTDSTHGLAAIRVLNRLELIGETMRAALNKLSTVAPTWLQSVASHDWYQRYGRRIEDDRLPQSQEQRIAYAQSLMKMAFTDWNSSTLQRCRLTGVPCPRSRLCVWSWPILYLCAARRRRSK